MVRAGRCIAAACLVAMPPLAACAASYAMRDPAALSRDLAMTCWRLAGRGLQGDAFWSGLVRLDTAAPRGAYRPSETRAVVPLAATAEYDSLAYATVWRSAARDSLEVVRSTGSSGVGLDLRVQGDSVRGTSAWFINVEPYRQARPDTVTGVRVPCPEAGRRR